MGASRCPRSRSGPAPHRSFREEQLGCGARAGLLTLGFPATHGRERSPAPSRSSLRAPVADAGELPNHSGGTAADSHGLPFSPVTGTRAHSLCRGIYHTRARSVNRGGRCAVGSRAAEHHEPEELHVDRRHHRAHARLFWRDRSTVIGHCVRENSRSVRQGAFHDRPNPDAGCRDARGSVRRAVATRTACEWAVPVDDFSCVSGRLVHSSRPSLQREIAIG